MNKKTKKLLQDLGYPEYCDSKLPEALNIEKENVRQMVNQVLDSVPREKLRHRRQKRIKAAAILVALLVLTTTTALAASRLDFLRLFFTGDFSSLEEHVKTTQTSITDGKFTLTVERVLAYESRVMLLYSVEGVTEEGQKELMNAFFNGRIVIGYSEGAHAGFGSQNELEELRTENKRVYSYVCENVYNPQKQPLLFSADFITGDQVIEIPIDDVVEILELSLTTPSGRPVLVRLSPLDLVIIKDEPTETENRRSDLQLHFRMQDGSLRKHTELFHNTGSVWVAGESTSDEPYRYQHNAVAREMLDISQIKSIILEGVEYDLSDPSQGKEPEFGEVLRPFRQSLVYYNDYLMVPLEEVIRKLGGEISLDQAEQSANIQYRGSTYEIQAGTGYYLKDGEQFSFQREPSVVYEETLLMERYGFQMCFGLDVEFELAQPLEDSKLYIMP